VDKSAVLGHADRVSYPPPKAVPLRDCAAPVVSGVR